MISLALALILDCAPVSIDCGRQLFVDRQLIASTDLVRTAHQPREVDFNPIMKAETELESSPSGNPYTAPLGGGIWWDPADDIFKMWYNAGFCHALAYATSKDGIHWERPELDVVPGTNRVTADSLWSDSSTIWIDFETKDASQRYKAFVRPPNKVVDGQGTRRYNHGYSMVSADGIHWSEPVKSGICNDRSTFFYNPIRRKWTYSLRWGFPPGPARARACVEADDFLEGVKWPTPGEDFWIQADSLDIPDPEVGMPAELYNFDAVPYESVMIGMPQVYLGPSNKDCMAVGLPKHTYLGIAYSRDGISWDRSDRERYVSPDRTRDNWKRGYVQSVCGLFNVVGDQLWIHFSAARGDSTRLGKTTFDNGMYCGGATGMAVLRRDGFVSYDGTGCLVTKPVMFSGRHLFVNVSGKLKVEVLDADGNPVKGFTAADCKPLDTDSTIARVRWKGCRSLRRLAGKPVVFRFILEDGSLYSFWVSGERNGASHGYAAAGGPGFKSSTDTEGIRAYRRARRYMIDESCFSGE